MNGQLQQSATNALSGNVGTVSTVYTLSSGVAAVLGWLTPVIGLFATTLGVVSMVIIIKNNRKKSTLLDLQIAEHRRRLANHG